MLLKIGHEGNTQASDDSLIIRQEQKMLLNSHFMGHRFKGRELQVGTFYHSEDQFSKVWLRRNPVLMIAGLDNVIRLYNRIRSCYLIK